MSAITQDDVAAARVRCHILVEQLPAEGLPEAEESLEEMCKFYCLDVPVPHAARFTDITGTVVGSYVRPVFQVDEE